MELILVFFLTFCLCLLIGLALHQEKDNKAKLFEAVLAEQKSATAPDEGSWQKSFMDRIIIKSESSTGFKKFLNIFGYDSIKKRLIDSGHYEKEALFYYLSFKVICLLIAALLILLRFSYAADASEFETFLFVLIILMFAYFLADVSLHFERKRFKAKLRKELPIFLDVFSLVLSSGFSIDNALKESAKLLKPHYPTIARDVTITYAELQHQSDRNIAWQHLVERANIDELEPVVEIIRSNENLGTDITASLNRHADKLRRMQQAAVDRRIERLPLLTTTCVMFFLLTITMIFIGSLVYFNAIHAVSQLSNLT